MMRLHIVEGKSGANHGGSPLLFVHGACLGAWCWQDHFLPFFASVGHHPVAFDLRGHGKSQGREALQRFTIDDHVADVKEVAGRFRQPPVVIGHSMGGLVAQRYARRYATQGVVLMAPSPIGGMAQQGWRLFAAHPWAFFAASLSRQMLRIYPDNRHVRHIMFSPGTPEETVTRCRERLQPESWRACMEMKRAAPAPNSTGSPFLVLGGAMDSTVPAEAVIETAHAYRASCEIFANMGHNLMLEPGWKEVAHRIADWIAGTVEFHERFHEGIAMHSETPVSHGR